MNLNNPIKWCDATWNPITGCLNDCPYCYARKLAEGRLKGRHGYDHGFAPTFHPDRLREPYERKTPTKIFVASMGDMFGDWMTDHRNWIRDVMGVVHDNPQHTFQFLTKFPQNFNHLIGDDIFTRLQPNMWLGVSVTCQDDLWRIDHLRKVVGGVRFVSFEPLLEDVGIHKPDLTGIDWAIIGAETGKRNDRVTPPAQWFDNLSAWVACKGIPLFQKDNILPYVPDWSGLWQEFPEVI